MAARRLVAVMLVLLFLSSLAAALAPVERPDEDAPESTPAPATKPVSDEGRLVRKTIDADAKREATVKVRVGDQLQLRVRSSKPRTIELLRLGPTDDAALGVPATFDVLATQEGTFPIRILETGRRIGQIEIRPVRRARTEPARPASVARS
jgi:hypothetical protein